MEKKIEDLLCVSNCFESLCDNCQSRYVLIIKENVRLREIYRQIKYEGRSPKDFDIAEDHIAERIN